jgi:hypothetical protein
MTKQKKYLVSGIGPGKSGTGLLLAYLIPHAEKNGYRALYKTGRITIDNLAGMIKGRDPISRIARKSLSILARIIKGVQNKRTVNRIRGIRYAEVLFFHPQTLGFEVLFTLIDNGNSISFYTLDNSFFCIRSHNYRDTGYSECIDCINGLDNCHQSCNPFPIPCNRESNLEWLKRFRKLGSRIHFYAQNEGQALLLRKWFGDDTGINVCGMVTHEFRGVVDRGLPPIDEVYDVVYHGSWISAKGIHYVLDLAKNCPGFTFLIPYPREFIEMKNPGLQATENVIFKSCSWDSGLREYVRGSRVVMCPSLWSAPVESGLVKSLLYNGNVAVVDTDYGFQAELPEWLLIRLTNDMKESARKLVLMADVDNDHRSRVFQWTTKFIEEHDPVSIFQPGTGI